MIMKINQKRSSGRKNLRAAIVTVIKILLFGIYSITALGQLEPRTFNSFPTQTDNQPRPLALTEAFPFFVSAVSPGRYRVSWNIAEGHYLYRHAFNFQLKQTADAAPMTVEYILPEGIQKTDQFFGKIEAYYNLINADLALTTVPSPDAVLVIEYQGCAEWGFCYPPQQAEFKLIP